jgi:hydrogenase maturation protease
MKKDTVVVGIGNPLMSDEGVGVHLIQRLLNLPDKYPSVEFVDGGTGGLSILHTISDRCKAVIIDCARMGAEPGTIKRFTPQDVQSTKTLSHQSLHEADLLKLIDLASQLGRCPAEVVIFGIEPASIEPGLRLSRPITDKMEQYAAAICLELDR